jgi:hypothetical protein
MRGDARLVSQLILMATRILRPKSSVYETESKMNSRRKTKDKIDDKSVASKTTLAESSAVSIESAVAEMTEEQRKAIRNVLSRQAAETAPGVKLSRDDDRTELTIDSAHQKLGHMLLMEAVGTGNVHFLNGLLSVLGHASSTGTDEDEQKLNFMLSIIASPNADRQFEAMCKSLMAATFNAAMDCTGKLRNPAYPDQLDSAGRAAGKLMASFVNLWDALERHQGRGTPAVNVENVNVNEGAQAIVGSIIRAPTTHENAHKELPTSTPPALTDARSVAMPVIDPNDERAIVRQHESLPRYRPAMPQPRPGQSNKKERTADPVRRNRT